MRNSRTTLRRMTLILFMVIIVIVASVSSMELLLRFSGRYLTYAEENFGYYASYYNQERPTWFHVMNPDITKTFDAREFDFEVKTNREGIRDTEHEITKPDGVKRIIFLGDSFVEGVGAAFKDTWFKKLEDSLVDSDLPVEIISGGVSGSDIFYSYQLLKHKLHRYYPDMVLLAINDSDLTDWVFRGGMERFQANGTTRFRDGPWFEGVFQRFHSVRFFVTLVGYDPKLLIRKDKLSATMSRAKKEITGGLAYFEKLAGDHSLPVVVVFHPTPGNLAWFTYPFDSSFFSQAATSTNLAIINLEPYLRGIITRENYNDYAWPIDCHYNARGYEVMAEKTKQALEERGLLHFNEDNGS